MKQLIRYMKNKKVGSTPIIEYQNLYYKLEFYNPTGSIKDRAAYKILENYFEKGLIKENTTIVLATSGNMGISFAYFGMKFKIKVVIVMPEGLSIERYNLLKRYKAEIILTKCELGMEGAIMKALELAQTKGYFLIDQFDNPYNKLANIETGKEIIKDIPNVDYIICGIGTGGTISGICEYMKQNKIKVDIVGVEPYESPKITKNKKGKHLIQGIGAGIIPSLINLNDIYEVETVKSKMVIEKFKNNNPLLLGLSSIACEIVAKRIKTKNPKAKIVIVVADGMDRYGSMIK